jgi:nucleoside-diphosphate-sugar epimerase
MISHHTNMSDTDPVSSEVILVTGGAGLLGNELISALLHKGKKVVAIYNKSPLTHSAHSNLRQLQCDILDVVSLEEMMHGVTQIFHCAGLVSFQRSDVQRLYKINVEGTSNLVNAALHAGVKKIVHVSSVAALGRSKPEEAIHEKMNWTPESSRSKYGESKYLGEMEVWRGIAEGMTGVIINPSIILGPGNWEAGSTSLFKTAYDEFPWYSTGTTGFVGVKDVVAAMIQLMESPVSAERFIISAHNASYQHVLNIMADAFRKKRPVKRVTPFMAKWVSRIEGVKSIVTGKPPLITVETASSALAHVQYDNSKFLSAFPAFEYDILENIIKESCFELQQKLNKY